MYVGPGKMQICALSAFTICKYCFPGAWAIDLSTAFNSIICVEASDEFQQILSLNCWTIQRESVGIQPQSNSNQLYLSLNCWTVERE